jgi:phage repressor protein C with HTH and peptisase S24 domain
MSLGELRAQLSQRGVEITVSALSRWETGKTVPNAYQFLAVIQALGLEQNLSYFTGTEGQLNEEGLKKLLSYQQDLLDTGKYQVLPPAITPMIRYVEMPVSALPASAGTGSFLEEDSFQKISVPADSIPAGAVFGVRVSGDSMEPVYQDGQIVWVQPCSQLRSGEVGIFIYDGEGYIKVFHQQEPQGEAREQLADSEGYLPMQPVLVSYNPAYPPRPVSPQREFRIVGRVLKG